MRLSIVILSMHLIIASVAQAQEHKEYLIKSIYFGGGSYSIDSLQVEELYHFIDSIPNINSYTISIHSHTDNIGGVQYNEWLSGMRGDAVIHQLILKDLDSENMVIKDFGQYNPVYDNATYMGRIKNRRVDIIFWPMVL